MIYYGSTRRSIHPFIHCVDVALCRISFLLISTLRCAFFSVFFSVVFLVCLCVDFVSWNYYECRIKFQFCFYFLLFAMEMQWQR